MCSRELLGGSSLSTLVQMVSAGIGVTLIPDMAVAVETRSASISVARFKRPRRSRTVGRRRPRRRNQAPPSCAELPKQSHTYVCRSPDGRKSDVNAWQERRT
jgi:DNA-binding transcriptional LysR family regulator